MTDPDLQDLWQSQPIVRTELSMEAITKQANQFQTTIVRRNLGEYVAGLFVVVVFGVYALGDHPALMRAGAFLTALGTVVAITNIRLRGHASEQGPPMNVPTAELVAWHRAELLRQQALLEAVPRWYLGPMIPGTVVFLVGGILASGTSRFAALVVPLTVALTFGSILWLNRRAAQRLAAQARELDP